MFIWWSSSPGVVWSARPAPPSIGDHFCPALDISGCVSPVLLNIESPGVAFHVCRSLFTPPIMSLPDPILYFPVHGTPEEPSTVHANESP